MYSSRYESIYFEVKLFSNSITLSYSQVNCDEASDLKLNKEKLAEAKKVLGEVSTKLKSSYIQNFASLLLKGVTDLEVNQSL